MFGKGGSGGAAGAGAGAGGDDLQQLLATIRAARDDKTRVEILRANVARRESRVPAGQLLEILRTAGGAEARKTILALFSRFLGDDVGNYRAIVDLFTDANDRAQVASTLIAARHAEGAEAASLREDLLSLNIAQTGAAVAPAGLGTASSCSSTSSTFAARRREEAAGGGGDGASVAGATVGSGSMTGMAQSPLGGGGMLGSPMDLSSDGSADGDGDGDGDGSGHGARSLGGSTLNSQEVELGAEEGEDHDDACNLSLEAAASPMFGPSAGSVGQHSVGSGAAPASVGAGTHGQAAPTTTAASASAASARGAMPPPLTIPSAAHAAPSASGSSSHAAHGGSAQIGIGGGAAEDISLVVVGSVATTISSYDSVGSLSTIESSASAEVSQRGRQPFTARSSLLKPVAEPDSS